MKVLFSDKFDKTKQADMDILPKKGDKIVWFYEPYPKVKEIVWNVDKNFVFIGLE